MSINELREEAKELMLRLLPPDVFGENSDCERLYDIIQTLGEEWVPRKFGYPLPDYDEYVMWWTEEGHVIYGELDKDGNDWLDTMKVTHWKRIIPPTE